MTRGLVPGAVLAGLIGVALAPSPAAAQTPRVDAMARGVVALMRADPTPEGGALSELRVLQPVVGVRLVRGGLGARLTANFEGLTLPDGELAPGNWGEGFVDRRHPHTYVHEVVLSGMTRWHGWRLGTVVGKGFVPFGSDDPMTRPLLRYPVNHHLSQILERAIVVGQVGRGPVALEGALFNGDEPEGPGSWPRLARFGDSWSLRLTARPLPSLELSGSLASVASPEHRPGAGSTQRKGHVSARFERRTEAGGIVALLEWARTSELDGFFVFHSGLAEGAWRHGRHQLAYRFERTERPEEERLSAYRSARPHLENSILGVTRWTIHTGSYTLRITPTPRPVAVSLLVEGAVGRIRSVGAGTFDPRDTYGRETFWTATFGLRFGWHGKTHRMGRYGIVGDEHP
jgi:hypothetical protein